MSVGDMVEVRLAHPVKLGICWLDPGAHRVTPEDAAALRAAGVLDTSPDAAAPGVDLRRGAIDALPAGGRLITVTEEQFHTAVAAQAEALAGAVADAAIEGLENQTRRVEELQTELAAERIAHDETRAMLAEIQNARAEIPAHEAPAEAGETPTRTDTPPSEPPAETAPKKKGAAGITKG